MLSFASGMNCLRQQNKLRKQGRCPCYTREESTGIVRAQGRVYLTQIKSCNRDLWLRTGRLFIVEFSCLCRIGSEDQVNRLWHVPLCLCHNYNLIDSSLFNSPFVSQIPIILYLLKCFPVTLSYLLLAINITKHGMLLSKLRHIYLMRLSS